MNEVKYTDEMTNELSEAYLKGMSYEERRQIIDTYADKWNKTPRMIIAKLSKMKIYKTKPNISVVTGEKPMTKEQIVRKIEYKLELNRHELSGLDKSPKLVLAALLRGLDNVREV